MKLHFIKYLGGSEGVPNYANAGKMTDLMTVLGDHCHLITSRG